MASSADIIALVASLVVFIVVSFAEDFLTNTFIGIIYDCANSIDLYSPIAGSLTRMLPPLIIAAGTYATLRAIIQMVNPNS